MCLWLSYKKKIYGEKNFVFASLKSLKKEVGSRVGSGSIGQKYGSADPDPHQKVKDPYNTAFNNHFLTFIRLLSKHLLSFVNFTADATMGSFKR